MTSSLPLSGVTESIQYGYTASSSPRGRGPKLLRITDIQKGSVDWKSVPRCATNDDTHGRFSLRDGDIVFARSGATVGKSFLIQGDVHDAVFASYLIRVRFDRNRVEPQYAYLFFASDGYWAQVNEGTSGTGQPNFNGTKLAALQMPVPPLAEQRRIVARVEALFSRTRRARADLERITPLSLRYEQTVRNEVLQAGQDAGWPVRTLGEVASEVRNGIAAKPSDQPPGTRILRISAVRQGRVLLDDVRYHRAAADTKTGPYLLRNRDLLFIRFNGNAQLVAACGMVRDLEGECVYPDKLIRMRMDQRLAVPEYIEMAAGSGVAREQLANHIKTAAGQHGISGGDLKTLVLPMPDLATQAAIAAEMASKRNSCLVAHREATRALALLDRLEQGILARAFRGELVPQDANAESVADSAQVIETPARMRRLRAA